MLYCNGFLTFDQGVKESLDILFPETSGGSVVIVKDVMASHIFLSIMKGIMANEPLFQSVEELFAKLEVAYNHTFREFDVGHRLDNPNNKGALGQIVEEGILGYPANSNPDADISNLGIEIKVTGIISNKNGSLRAKERLTIDMLNYFSTASLSFEDSLMWKKAHRMLIVFYRYIEGMPVGEMPIIKAVLNEFDPVDVEIMKRDYEFIRRRIEEGKADQLSEGDTLFLGACTAGTGELVPQPYSEQKAKQRKFCLKQTFLTQLVRKYVSNSEYEHVLDIDEIKAATFEMSIQSQLQPYFGWKEAKIREHFSVKDDPNAKNRYERYLAAMLGVKGKVSETDEFQKAGIQVKTIRVQENGRIKESMSFPYFEFMDIFIQDWDDSDLKNMFLSTKYLFVVYQEKDGELYFDRIKFWHMKESELDEVVRPVFEKLKAIISSGNIVQSVFKNSAGKETRKTNFPGQTDNPILHVRPHARDASDTCDLPVPDRLTGATKYTKQCFWLNSSYVMSIISENKE